MKVESWDWACLDDSMEEGSWEISFDEDGLFIYSPDGTYDGVQDLTALASKPSPFVLVDGMQKEKVKVPILWGDIFQYVKRGQSHGVEVEISEGWPGTLMVKCWVDQKDHMAHPYDGLANTAALARTGWRWDGSDVVWVRESIPKSRKKSFRERFFSKTKDSATAGLEPVWPSAGTHATKAESSLTVAYRQQMELRRVNAQTEGMDAIGILEQQSNEDTRWMITVGMSDLYDAHYDSPNKSKIQVICRVFRDEAFVSELVVVDDITRHVRNTHRNKIQRFPVSFRDAAGKQKILRLSPSVAALLVDLLQEAGLASCEKVLYDRKHRKTLRDPRSFDK